MILTPIDPIALTLLPLLSLLFVGPVHTKFRSCISQNLTYNAIMKFDWDVNKECININKHGVTFEQASYVFSDPFALSKYDNEHSAKEDRWILLGKSLSDIILIVVHTFRDDNDSEFVRIVSARRATKKEERAYLERCPK